MSHAGGIQKYPGAPSWNPTHRLSPPLVDTGTSASNTPALRTVHGATITSTPAPSTAPRTRNGRQPTRPSAQAIPSAAATSSTWGRTSVAAPRLRAATVARSGRTVRLPASSAMVSAAARNTANRQMNSDSDRMAAE